jgi:hypothetical protein
MPSNSALSAPIARACASSRRYSRARDPRDRSGPAGEGTDSVGSWERRSTRWKHRPSRGERAPCQFATPRDQPVAGSWGQGEDIGIGLDDARDRGACRGLRSRALRARRRISLLQGDGASLGPCKKVGPPPSSPPSILNPPPTTWPRGWTAARRCVREMGGEGPAIAKRRWALRISGGACSAGSRAACGARALDRPRGHRAWA